ncbi:MAG: hypothetical protein N2513_08295 [Deltaproteobacteria bacterium]|nr:hypothetical protein [Deltaproteobacteria bacterium]
MKLLGTAMIRIFIPIIIGIFFSAIRFLSFAQNIPEPKPKIHCSFDGNWYTPEEYRIYCKAPQPKTSVSPKSSGSLSPYQQIQLQIFQGIFQPLFTSLFNFSNLFSLPQEDLSSRQHQEELQKNKKANNEAIKAWERHLQEAERRAELEIKERKKAGESILQKVGIGSSLSLQRTEHSLVPIEWDYPRGTNLTPQVFQNPSETVKEQLLRTAYFSKMAETALSNGELEIAKFWATIAFEGTSFSPRAIDYKPPKDLLYAMDSSKALEMNRKLTQHLRVIKEALPKFDEFQSILTKMEETKVKKETSQRKVKEVEEEIKKIEIQKQTAQTPDEKARSNDLLAKAIALKLEAEAEYQKALTEEQKLSQEKQALEKELNELRNRLMEAMK